jgi:hypothetical protein
LQVERCSTWSLKLVSHEGCEALGQAFKVDWCWRWRWFSESLVQPPEQTFEALRCSEVFQGELEVAHPCTIA